MGRYHWWRYLYNTGSCIEWSKPVLHRANRFRKTAANKNSAIFDSLEKMFAANELHELLPLFSFVRTNKFAQWNNCSKMKYLYCMSNSLNSWNRFCKHSIFDNIDCFKIESIEYIVYVIQYLRHLGVRWCILITHVTSPWNIENSYTTLWRNLVVYWKHLYDLMTSHSLMRLMIKAENTNGFHERKVLFTMQAFTLNFYR